MKKSIKNQYIALKEGKMTEAQFMRNVRMTLPEYISNVTLFKQAERILINKGIISEALISSKVEQLANKISKWYENHPNPKMKERISSVESTLEKLISKTVGKDAMSYDEFEKTIKSKFNLPFEDPNYSVFKKSLNEADNDIKSAKQNGDKSYTVKYEDDTKKIVYVNDNDWDEINKKYGNLNEASSEYMISKSGSKSNPSYVIEKTDGSKQIDMFFDSEEDAKKYASKKGLKLSSKSGYNIREDKDTLKEINTDGLKQMGYSDSDIEDFMDEWKQGGSKLPEKVRDYLDGLYNTRLGQLKTKSLREAKDTSATGYFNQDGKEQYGKFNELDNMNAQEIMAGYVMEKQDNPEIDIKEAIKTVLKNLKKDQFYYTNYKLSGIRDLQPTEFTTTKRKPFFDQMEELDKKGTNLVDEKNKMQVVKESKENKMKTQINEVKRMQQLAGLIKESKLVRKLNENQEYSAELSVDNIKNIIKDTNRFYREDKTTIEETSDGSIYVSMNGSRLMGETRTTLEKLFDVREESEEFASDRLPAYTYFISTKTTSDQDIPQKDKDFDEDVFENYDNKKSKLKEDQFYMDEMDGKSYIGYKVKFRVNGTEYEGIIRSLEGSDNTTQTLNYLIKYSKDGKEAIRSVNSRDMYDTSKSDNDVLKPDTKDKLKEMVRKMMKEMFDGRDNLTDIE
jgi:hypothetical protein